MNSRDAHLEPFWQSYLSLQRQSAEWREIDNRYWSLDEQLEYSLRRPPVADSIPKHLRANRAQKYRWRGRLLREQYAPICRSVSLPEDRAADRDELRWAYHQLAQPEMGIFQSLARGESYAGLARRLSLTVPALKSRIARSRARLRQLSARYRQARRSFAN